MSVTRILLRDDGDTLIPVKVLATHDKLDEIVEFAEVDTAKHTGRDVASVQGSAVALMDGSFEIEVVSKKPKISCLGLYVVKYTEQ